MSLFGSMLAGGAIAAGKMAAESDAQQGKIDLLNERERIDREYEARIHESNRSETLSDATKAREQQLADLQAKHKYNATLLEKKRKYESGESALDRKAKSRRTDAMENSTQLKANLKLYDGLVKDRTAIQTRIDENPNDVNLRARLEDINKDIASTIDTIKAIGSPKKSGMLEKGNPSSVKGGAAKSPVSPEKGNKSTVKAAPQNPAERKVGEVYSTPKGMLKWMGNGWLPVTKEANR